MNSEKTEKTPQDNPDILAKAFGGGRGHKHGPNYGFSIASNPNGVWSYGYTTGGSLDPLNPFGTFILLADSFTEGGVDLWQTNLQGSGTPWIGHNPTANPITLWNRVLIDSNGLALHPGPTGEYVVLRFTAPAASGSPGLRLEGSFFSLEDAAHAGSTNVWVMVNLREYIWTDTVNGFGSVSQITPKKPVILNVGDTLDFVVGVREANQGYYATGFKGSLH